MNVRLQRSVSPLDEKVSELIAMMWELIRQNRRQSLWLFAIMALVLVVLGFLVGIDGEPMRQTVYRGNFGYLQLSTTLKRKGEGT